jgi:hypothetical protein
MRALTAGQPVVYTDAELLVVQGLLESAQTFIEEETGRRFEAATQTRYYKGDAVPFHDPTLLLVDDDLLTVTSLTNGDGTVIASSLYWLEPRNKSPKFGIRLKSGAAWSFGTDGEVAVAGTWGYTAAASADVKRVTCRLAYLEQQRRTATGEVRVLGEGGFSFQASMPKDLAEWLTRRSRRRGNL